MALIDNLVRYFKFEENAENTNVADSTETSDATASTNTSNLSATGKINNGFDLNGSNERISHSGGILNVENALSISLWIKEDTLDGKGWFSDCSSNIGFSVYDSNSGNIQIRINNKRYWTNGSIVLSTGTWYHIVVTKASGATTTPKVYVNNQEYSLTALSNITQIDDNSIGRVFGTSYLDGIIDELGLWTKELTTQEISDLYNSGSGLTYPFIDAPVAEFEADLTEGERPLEITFTDLSTNSPTSWNWNFGDGNTSENQNPTNVYMAEGVYSVSLTATNLAGEDTETKTDYITITNQIITPENNTQIEGARGTKEIATKYPVESGLIAGTTKTSGRQINLKPRASIASNKHKVGLD